MAGIFARRHKPESPGFLFANPNRQRRGRPGTRVTLVRNKHRNATDLRCNKRFLNCSLFGGRNDEQMKPASFSCTQQLQANEPAYNLRQPENSVVAHPVLKHTGTLWSNLETRWKAPGHQLFYVIKSNVYTLSTYHFVNSHADHPGKKRKDSQSLPQLPSRELKWTKHVPSVRAPRQ